MTPENQIKRAICVWLRYQKAFFWVSDRVGIYDPTRKVFRSNKDPFRIKGVSDILGIWKGRPLAIEVKTKTGRVSPEQKSFIEKFNQAGGIAFIARSVGNVEETLLQNETSTALNAVSLNFATLGNPNGHGEVEN